MKFIIQLYFLTGLFYSTLVFSESIPSIEIENYQNDLAYLINGPTTVVGLNYEEACEHLSGFGYSWKIIPTTDTNPACYSPTDNRITGADTWYCADGSLAYYNTPWWYCPRFRVCPNSTWTLTTDKLNCTRPTSTCSATPASASEVQLIAAIAYGEATPGGSYEEKAAIANAIVRKSKAYGYATVNDFVMNKRTRRQISALNPPNIRARLVLCSDVEIEYPDLYAAASNALDEEGIDYANGGCFWDGTDLKTAGTKHKHYKWGYMFSDSLHDVLNVGDTPAKDITTAQGHYDYTLESTAGYGHTVFWKYTNDYLNAMRGKQCR